MKAENRAILITYYTMALSQFCVHRGTTVKRFTAFVAPNNEKRRVAAVEGLRRRYGQAEATVT